MARCVRQGMYASICHMKRTTIFVDEALEHDLKAIAGRRGQPVATVVREALAQYVASDKRGRRTNLSFVAAGASGHADTAERHDEALWPQKGRSRSG
jgi:predicted transcriptional regulator